MLVAALVKSLATWTGAEELFFNLEGHGREEIGDELDVTRTTGWFTSIFPVRLTIDSDLVRSRVRTDWDPAGLLTVVKSHLRRVPLHGLGYGVLRYLASKNPLPNEREPEITFNYLGQLDSMSTSSTLFTFAPETTGPNHSPNQQRRYLLEVNSAVIGGRFKVDWTFSKNRHETETIERLAENFIAALRRVLDRCESTEIGDVREASSQLEPQRPSMLSERVVDVYPLSPMQTLFFTLASARPHALVDQWHCTLEGELDVPAFQKAWAEAIKHHAVLRSSFDGEASTQPVQRVHAAIYPDWTLEDWRAASPEEQTDRWNGLLAADSKQSFVLSRAPLMRFALRQVGERSHKFLWTLPALLVDGWSWPLVFQSVAQAYESFLNKNVPNLQPVRQFRDYIDWLQELDWSQTEAFWRRTLHGFRRPTRVSLGVTGTQKSPGDSFERLSCACGNEMSKAVATLARTLHVTSSTVIQACWAMILGRRSSSNDVVFGVAFSGRPATLSGAESIVGPFVSNLPLRVRIDGGASLRALLTQVHTQSLESSQHQFASPLQVQEWSEVSGPDRLFESLLVIQNYQVNELAVTLGATGRLTDFVGPIHSNFDVTVVVTPRERLRIEFVFNPTRLDREIIKAFSKDLEGLLALLPVSLDKPVRELQASLRTPALNLQSAQRSHPRGTKTAPQSDTERKIVRVCQEVLGIDCVGVEDNILESGAHSLTMVKLHVQLQTTLGINLPIVRMFQYPTARSLAQHLNGAFDDSQDLSNISERARQQRHALSQIHGAREVRR